MSFDKVHLRDRDFQAYRQKPSGAIVRAVCVENTASSPIPVSIVNEAVSGNIIKSEFGEALSVASGSETTIVSYTIPVGKSGKLLRLEFGGENIAVYNCYINGNIEARVRTYFGGDLSSVMEFSGGTADGLPLAEGDVILLRVLHNRPTSGNFEGRIELVEITE